jgi:hypothetical protein
MYRHRNTDRRRSEVFTLLKLGAQRIVQFSTELQLGAQLLDGGVILVADKFVLGVDRRR